MSIRKAKARGETAPADDFPRLDDQLCFMFYVTSRAIIDAYRPVLTSLGLTYPQYLVMLVLWEQDGLTIGVIGERLLLDSGTLTPLLKRLEARGILDRTRDETDERQVRITLTKAGRQLKRAARVIPEALSCKLTLPASTVKELRLGMELLMRTLGVEMGRASSRVRRA